MRKQAKKVVANTQVTAATKIPSLVVFFERRAKPFWSIPQGMRHALRSSFALLSSAKLQRVVGGRAGGVPAKPKRGDLCGEQRQAGTKPARKSEALRKHCEAMLTALHFREC